MTREMVYTCDRCKKKIDKNPRTVDVRENGQKPQPPEAKYEDLTDLCPYCFELLRLWLRGAGEGTATRLS